MLISRLFGRPPVPRARFAPGLFVALLATGTILLNVDLMVGLTILGVTLIMAAGLVLTNRGRIWSGYLKEYKKARHPKGAWHEPKRLYYTLNVLVLWPLVALLGITCLFAALTLTGA